MHIRYSGVRVSTSGTHRRCRQSNGIAWLASVGMSMRRRMLLMLLGVRRSDDVVSIRGRSTLHAIER